MPSPALFVLDASLEYVPAEKEDVLRHPAVVAELALIREGARETIDTHRREAAAAMESLRDALAIIEKLTQGGE